MSLFDTQWTHSQWFNHILKKNWICRRRHFAVDIQNRGFRNLRPYENRVGGIHSEEQSDNRDPTSFNKFVL